MTPWSPSTAPFWRGCEDGRLLTQRCQQCGHRQLPPRYRCPSCDSLDLEWSPTTGSGTIHAVTTVHRGPTQDADVPYVLALVDLDDGARLLARVDVADATDAPIGTRVTVGFSPPDDEGRCLPRFTPTG